MMIGRVARDTSSRRGKSVPPRSRCGGSTTCSGSGSGSSGSSSRRCSAPVPYQTGPSSDWLQLAHISPIISSLVGHGTSGFDENRDVITHVRSEVQQLQFGLYPLVDPVGSCKVETSGVASNGITQFKVAWLQR
jgi:hypothetical protein